jgi:hypothetical protein
MAKASSWVSAPERRAIMKILLKISIYGCATCLVLVLVVALDLGTLTYRLLPSALQLGVSALFLVGLFVLGVWLGVDDTVSRDDSASWKHRTLVALHQRGGTCLVWDAYRGRSGALEIRGLHMEDRAGKPVVSRPQRPGHGSRSSHDPGPRGAGRNPRPSQTGSPGPARHTKPCARNHACSSRALHGSSPCVRQWVR